MHHYRITLTTVFGGLVQPKNVYDFELADSNFIGFTNGWFKIGNIYSIEARHVIGYKIEKLEKIAHSGCNRVD